MIPKIIHYVWVGDKPKPELVLKCIESWKKYCPDYEIKEWGNDCLKDIDNTYVKEAFEAKKWAFVSDYIRLLALRKYGGIYLDTDLEITKNLDIFLKNDFFMGYEIYQEKLGYQTALIGAIKNHKIINDILSQYNNIRFIVNGKMDMTPNPKKFATYFETNYHLKQKNITDKKRVVDKGITIYPTHYFCRPLEHKTNYAIHHFDGSWLDPYTRKEKFQFGKFKLIAIKSNDIFSKRTTNQGRNSLIQKNEHVLFEWKKNKRTTLYIIKRD